MPNFSPELIAIMRTVLDDVMRHVPIEHVTSGIKVRLAELILRAAGEGHTSYDALFAAAFNQIQTVISMST